MSPGRRRAECQKPRCIGICKLLISRGRIRGLTRCPKQMFLAQWPVINFRVARDPTAIGTHGSTDLSTSQNRTSGPRPALAEKLLTDMMIFS